MMSRITESSLMDEDIPVRYCFVMLLAVADPQGYAIGTDVALARRLNMPLQEFKSCIHKLMQPDPDSNSKEEEGRRVIESDCERGYYLVNYTKYRDTRDEEQRREYMREYMRNYREGKGVTPVNKRKQRKPQLAKVDVKEDCVKKAALKQEDFIASLKTEKAYEGVDIDREFSKAQVWCKTNSRILTQRFFVNWLGKADRTLSHNGSTPASVQVRL